MVFNTLDISIPVLRENLIQLSNLYAKKAIGVTSNSQVIKDIEERIPMPATLIRGALSNTISKLSYDQFSKVLVSEFGTAQPSITKISEWIYSKNSDNEEN